MDFSRYVTEFMNRRKHNLKQLVHVYLQSDVLFYCKALMNKSKILRTFCKLECELDDIVCT